MRLPSSFITNTEKESLAKKRMDKDIESVLGYLLTTVPQRVPVKVWREMLLRGNDTFMAHGNMYQIKAKNLGAGVYELTRNLYAFFIDKAKEV